MARRKTESETVSGPGESPTPITATAPPKKDELFSKVDATTVTPRMPQRAPPAWSARVSLKVEPTTVRSRPAYMAPPDPMIADDIPVIIQEIFEPDRVPSNEEFDT